MDEGFQEPQLPPPRQPSRGGGSRFSSRPQFTPDFGSEVDTVTIYLKINYSTKKVGVGYSSNEEKKAT